MRTPFKQFVIPSLILIVALAQPSFAVEQLKPGYLSVEYKDGLLSVTARQADIADMFRTIGKKAGIRVSISRSLSRKISVKFADLPVHKAIVRLTRNGVSNYIEMFGDDKYPGGENRVTELILLEGFTIRPNEMLELTKASGNQDKTGEVIFNGAIKVRVLRHGEIGQEIKRFNLMKNRKREVRQRLVTLGEKDTNDRRKHLAEQEKLKGLINSTEGRENKRELILKSGKMAKQNRRTAETSREVIQQIGHQYDQLAQEIDQTRGNLIVTAEILSRSLDEGTGQPSPAPGAGAAGQVAEAQMEQENSDSQQTTERNTSQLNQINDVLMQDYQEARAQSQTEPVTRSERRRSTGPPDSVRRGRRR